MYLNKRNINKVYTISSSFKNTNSQRTFMELQTHFLKTITKHFGEVVASLSWETNWNKSLIARNFILIEGRL